MVKLGSEVEGYKKWGVRQIALMHKNVGLNSVSNLNLMLNFRVCSSRKKFHESNIVECGRTRKNGFHIFFQLFNFMKLVIMLKFPFGDQLVPDTSNIYNNIMRHK